MTWFRRDDNTRRHPKVRKARRMERLSIYLWQEVGEACGELNSDGLVVRDLIDDAAHDCYFTDEEVEASINALVTVGLWHDRKTIRKCEECTKRVALLDNGRLLADEWYFHGFLDRNPTKNEARIPEERMKENRRKDLSRDKKLREQIIERDGHQCRYCRVRVDFKDHHGPDGGTYDHVDPDGPNELWNVVVCCRADNSEKKDRTPDEWYAAGGKLLLPPPDRTPAPAEHGSNLGPSDVRPHVRDVRDSGRAGPGSSPGRTSAELATSSNGHSTNGHANGAAPMNGD